MQLSRQGKGVREEPEAASRRTQGLCASGERSSRGLRSPISRQPAGPSALHLQPPFSSWSPEGRSPPRLPAPTSVPHLASPKRHTFTLEFQSFAVSYVAHKDGRIDQWKPG